MLMSSLGPILGRGSREKLLWRPVGIIGAGIWLLYLQSVFSALGGADGWTRPVGLAALSAFCVVYLVGMARVSYFAWEGSYGDQPVAWSYVVALLVLGLLTVPGAGDQATTCAVFIGAATVVALPVRQSVVAVLVLFAAVEASVHLVPGWQSNGNGFSVLLAALVVGFMRLSFSRGRALRDAQQQLAEAAVAAERARIARDLHDILGHSLTVVTVKAELAGRLLDLDPDRARSELADVERLSRAALADVRSTTQGLRGVSLAGEVAAAREALESAGIDGSLPTTTDEVPSQWRELFAWTIREAVTNVVRHSRAAHCVIELSGTGVSVRDDGVGLPESLQLLGHGLAGLRQRAESAGATLTTTSAAGRGVCVRVSLPSAPEVTP